MIRKYDYDKRKKKEKNNSVFNKPRKLPPERNQPLLHCKCQL